MKKHLVSSKTFKTKLLLFISTCLVILTLNDMSLGADMPVLKFDWRDCFYEVSYIQKDKAVIVGSRGTVLVTHPKYKNLWSPRSSGTKDLLTCMDFIDEKRGWAAGHGGIVIHTEDGGETWQIIRKSVPDNLPLLDIDFVSREVGYACGAYDTFLKTTDGGNTWEALPLGDDYMLNGLAFVDKNRGYLVGEFGSVFKTVDGGRSWHRLETGGFEGSFFGITLISEEIIIVYGVAGKLIRSTDGGQNWNDVATNVDQPLFRGAAHGANVVVVGSTGTIIYSRDKGETFLKRIDEEFRTFAGVGVHPDGGFTCVGERGTILRFDPSAQD